MATVTKPMALDESINTTESTSRNIADVLAQELSGIASAITGGDGKANKTDIATVESGSTASRAYSVGELVYVNGNLYKVITAIASGATFTVGTNIQSTNVSGTVEDALSQLSNKMGTLKIQPITVGPSMTNNIPFKRCALLYFGRLSDHYLYTVSYEGRTKAVVAEGTFVSSISGNSSNISISTTGGYDHFGFIITSEI
jgi:hypothetical protein